MLSNAKFQQLLQDFDLRARHNGKYFFKNYMRHWARAVLERVFWAAIFYLSSFKRR